MKWEEKKIFIAHFKYQESRIQLLVDFILFMKFKNQCGRVSIFVKLLLDTSMSRQAIKPTAIWLT